jgi:hypothetical protein
VVDVYNVGDFFVVMSLSLPQESGRKLDVRFVPLDAEVGQLVQGGELRLVVLVVVVIVSLPKLPSSCVHFPVKYLPGLFVNLCVVGLVGV